MLSSSLLLFGFSLRDRLAAMSWFEMVLWIGLASLTVALLSLMSTRWGHVRPVSKCVGLSVFAHLLFLAYAYGTKLDFANGWNLEPSIRVSLTESDDEDGQGIEARPDLLPVDELEPPVEPMPMLAANPDEPPPEMHSVESPPLVAQAGPEPPATEPSLMSDPPALLPTPEPPPIAAVEPPSAEPEPQPEAAPAASPPDAIAESGPAPTESLADAAPADSREATPSVEPSATEVADAPAPATAWPNPANANERHADAPPAEMFAAAAPPPNPGRRAVDDQPMPAPYRLRTAENRMQLAIPFGATETSEASVRSALNWLASVQSADGRWDASDFGAGRETKTLGHDRQGAGTDADAGLTGLALLAMLGTGETHVQGEHRESVQRGLEYLLRVQAPDGNLAGPARLFEKMYCHGIATLALGEAWAMTGDPRLQPAITRAVGYSIASQHRSSGGWRYQPGDQGDVSQFGWQVMALRSAELGGLGMDPNAHLLMTKFLKSATSGRQQGLAGYRAGERPTRTMTAEAMACRFFLRTPPSGAAAQEATEFIMQELPDHGQSNLYYWYYATLALFQNQGPAWQTWNASLQHRLLSTQRRDGRLAGSWDTDDVWGGYGGRIYTTAMAALCMEVYYRYLPVYETMEPSRQAETIRTWQPVRR